MNAEVSCDTLQIAPNGFLMPSVSVRAGKESEASALKKYVGVASSTLSPGVSKSQSQQRQLISGRDFKDILEACRPRTSSYMLPSPLANLLRISGSNEQESMIPNQGKKSKSERAASSFGRLQLKEWGTVDFDETEGPMSFPGSSMLRQSTARARSPVPGREIGDLSESSGKSSPSSSTASQFSNILGRSLERGTPSYTFLSGNQSPSHSLDVGGLKIQRSPSLDFESDGNGGDTKVELDADNFLMLMRQHDDKYSRAAIAPISRPSLDQTGMVSPIPGNGTMDETGLDQLGTSAGSVDANGGLGAALMRFNNTDDHLNMSRDLHSVKRIYSSSKMSSGTGSPSQFGSVSELRSRSVSTFASTNGLKVGSEPPELPPTPQAMQAFMRSQQIRLVQDPAGSLSSSFEQRRNMTVRKKKSAWYAACFRYTDSPLSLFLPFFVPR
jgi:hypothetical protein